MLIIRLVAPRAVEAAPSRYVALRVLLIVTYGTPRLPPSGSTAGCALALLKPSRQAKADAVGGGRRPARLRRAATPGRFSTVLIY